MFTKKLKVLVAIMATMGCLSSYAADNSIYIDQAGDNSTVTITQDGSGNKVKGILLNNSAGGTTDPAILRGNAQTINIGQVGAGNTLALGMNTTQGGTVTGYANIGGYLNYQITGGSNTGYININNNGQGTATGNVVDVTQTGNSNNFNLNMTGTSNQMTVNTRGGNSNSVVASINADKTLVNIDQSGGGSNTTNLTMTGNQGQVNLTTIGAANNTTVNQSAYSALGSQALISITGSGNTTSVTQSGVADQYASITLNSGSNNNNITVSQVGNYADVANILLGNGSIGNTINLAQSGGGANGGQTATLELVAGSSSNNIGITQQGTVSNLVNLKVNGSNNSYTILQKN